MAKRTKRRGNGEGSIFQRGDGLWAAAITVGFDANGKRVSRTVYGRTKGEVQEKLTRMQSSRLDGTLTKSGRQTVAEFLNRWLSDTAKTTVRDTTHANYKRAIERHISTRIGGLRLDKLTPAHVQGAYAAMERDGASPDTRRLCHAVLRRALKLAVKWGLVPRNVCDAVEPPRLAKRDIQPLDVAQVNELLKAAAGDRLGALYFVAVTGGLRLGELFGLHWCDVDLEGGAVTVRHTLSELKGKLTLREPKTKKSRRRVELPKMAVDALHEHRKLALAAGHLVSGYVFTNTEGNPLRRSHFHRRDFKPLLKRAGLPPIRFHDLRHTSATLLLTQGEHPKVVQERLGHSQIGITLDTYSHVLPTMQRAAADKFDALLATAAG